MAKKLKGGKKRKPASAKQVRIKKSKSPSRPIGSQSFPRMFGEPIIGGGLIMFALALYFMTFNYGFILDDQVFYSKNKYVTEGFSGIGKLMTQEAMAGYFGEQKDLVTGGRYRPLSMISFAIEYALFELKPGLSHAINAFLYGISAFFLFYICKLFWPNDEERRWYLKIGFWAALLFIAHPIHTEVVANIKGRDEIMALLFALWTLIVAFKAKKTLDYILVGILFYLALLSKENALTFMAVIPLSIYVFRKYKIENREWVQLFTALILAAMLYLIQRYMAINYFLSSGKEITELLNNPFVDMNGSQKFATIFYTLLKYIQLLIWPHPLSHDYYPYAIATRDWSSVTSILSLLLYLAAGLFAVTKIFKRNVFAYFVLVFLATISIVSNIPFTVGTTMNERFIYMSSIAFVLFIPYVLTRKIRLTNSNSNVLAIALMTIMVGAFSFLTLRRIPVWSNSLALNRSAVEAYPNSARSNLFLGTALFNEAEAATDFEERKKLYKESASYISKSLDIHPIYGNALKMKAGVAAKLYSMDRNADRMFDVFTEVLLVKPGTRYVHDYIEYMINRGGDQRELVNYMYQLGFEEFGQRQGQYRWAEKFLQYGYRADPTNKTILRALAMTYDNLGMTSQADDFRSQLNR